MTENASNIKSVSTMTKQELYDEVKSSRVIISKYKETEEQINTYKMNLQTRSEHINQLTYKLNDFYKCFPALSVQEGNTVHQDYLKYLINYFKELKKEKDKNIKLEGDLVEALNNPLAAAILTPQADLTSECHTVELASQIFSDIEKLYKDKINKFDQMKIEYEKCKKILNNLNLGLSELQFI